jgi:hypothetical protein
LLSQKTQELLFAENFFKRLNIIRILFFSIQTHLQLPVEHLLLWQTMTSSAMPSVYKPKHIMMSYCWKGTQSLVNEVAVQLGNHNIPVWMDIRDGLGGSLNEG